MTSGVAKIQKKSHPIKQKRGEDLKTPKLKMEQRAEKRSSGKKGRKNFSVSCKKIASPGRRPKFTGKKLQRRRQSRLQSELMETELENLKGEIRESRESLSAAIIEADETEAKLEQLVTTRDELMGNLREMRATEAFLMHQLGFV
ncbi:hypothetical protein PTKIN_Ptkin06aG0164200 [Pterospermum kingtungense]